VVNKTLEEIQASREELIRSISREAGQKLKMLLEEKHIYQQVIIDAKSLISAWATKVRAASSGIMIDETEFDKEHFVMATSKMSLAERSGPPQGAPQLTLLLQNPKLFCAKCDASEVFRPVWYHDLTNELLKDQRFGHHTGPAVEVPSGFQIFTILLQCQRCTGKPETVLVRKEQWRLSLHGRSPMEHVEVPKFIPKQERDLFRDAMIAAHGGKILAALFYLRVFIEQFARRVIGETGRRFGDELMEEYGKTLPEAHRSTMPSLREWYEKLSEPIHAAKEDPRLFEEAKDAIVQHFEIRRVFKMSETPPVPKTTVT
jgi:hypothetical protein